LLSKDIRGIILEDYLKMLQYEVDRISNHFGMELRLLVEKNEINIYLDNKIFESLSSGEKVRVNLIIQNAMLNLYNISCNVKIFDEIFDGLDMRGIDSVYEFLSGFVDENRDCLILISHNPNVAVPINFKKLTMIKEKDGYSYLNS
jgi:Fe-S cluster assembly ATPase SufC